MKPIIGIIGRNGFNESDKRIVYSYKNIVSIIDSYNLPSITINKTKDYKMLIDLCDGIIIPGGSDIEEYDLEIIRYCHLKDIPILGICLGMQEMGLCFNGKIKKVNGHYNTVHEVKMNNSKLDIDGNIIVNSRHKYALLKTNLDITGKSDFIEAIEDKNKKFFVGIQWHPEDTFTYNYISKRLFSSFIDIVKGV